MIRRRSAGYAVVRSDLLGLLDEIDDSAFHIKYDPSPAKRADDPVDRAILDPDVGYFKVCRKFRGYVFDRRHFKKHVLVLVSIRQAAQVRTALVVW